MRYVASLLLSYGLRDYGVDGQIGLEETPDEWCARLVDVFREVRRVLRRDGTCWIECGDSYASSSTYNTTNTLHTEHGWKQDVERRPNIRAREIGLKPKDMVGAPWMLAFALRQDGWYLRSDIIWARPNPMPESVTDRPTKAHSYVFLLAKQARYFYDADAIREPAIRAGDIPRGDHDRAQDGYTKPGWGSGPVPTNRNKRSVWSIAGDEAVRLRSDLSEADRAYVLGELHARGLLGGT